MATASSLISRIDFVLGSLARVSLYRNPQTPHEMRRALRNLNLLLICLRNTGNDDISDLMRSLFSRIEDEVSRIPTEKNNPFELSRMRVDEIYCLVKEVSDEMDTDTVSHCLTLDDAIEVAGSVPLNAHDLWEVQDELYFTGNPKTANLQGLIDEFEVQMRFLRDFLLFAKRTVFEDQQIMQSLLIDIRRFVLDAARNGIFRSSDADWVEEVKSKCPRVDPQVFQACTQTLLSITTLDDVDDDVLKDFLSSLISLLWHVLRFRHHHPLHSDSLKSLYECLRLSRFNGDFKDHIGVLIRDAGIIIYSVYLSGVDSSFLSDVLQRFDVLQAQLPLEPNISNANALEDISDAVPSHQTSSTPPDAGFQDDEMTSILDRLTGGSKQLRLVPISGMAGIGKTTFALKVYNQSSVIYRFQVRAWCTISQIFDKKKVLIQLLNQIQPGNYSNMSEDDLANKLRQSLKGRRYLILLDDVWTSEVWESLSPSFPDDGTESRVVLTSRLHTIIPHMHPDEQPHFLRLRNENECLEIIELKLGVRAELETFAKLCRGLPLTAVLIAGLLGTTAQQGWEGIRDHLNSGGISRMEQCKIALELSYENLSHELKLCFLYFGVFPEDEEIYARKLILLWMAEGFVAQTADLLKKRAEDVARVYLDKLIQRNLVMIAKERSMGGVKTCKIHDLLHDFCLIKGKQENLFHVLGHDAISDFNEPSSLERLSIHTGAPHLKESMLFCPRAQSMLFFHNTGNLSNLYLIDMLFIIQIYKLLRVLDIELIRFVTEIPSEIALLTQLTHLSICCRVPVIPESIGNLSNLETLIIRFFHRIDPVPLPHTIWCLQKLKYLSITLEYGLFPAFHLRIENIESYPSLLKLEVIIGIVFDFDGSMEKQMRKFPNIRRLKGNIVRGEESSQELNNIVAVPECLNKLESITLHRRTPLQHNLDFGYGESLRKVTLQRFVLSREEIAVLGKLPTLEILKLLDISFLGGIMEMEEGEFSKLRILELNSSISLETWIAAEEEEQLPSLEKLTFSGCTYLKEIPCSCLENVSTLEQIEVLHCSSALESLARDIQEVQKDFGNLIRLRIS